MAQTKLGPNPANTIGELPTVGIQAPEFVLTSSDMKDVSLKDFAGKNVVLNIFPSVDTGVCATSVREFNKRVASLDNTVVLCISKDLPFAMKRFCGAEGIDKAITLSDFRSRGFGKTYGVELLDSAFAGLFARAVVVIDGNGKVKYNQLVPQIGEEPNYEAALKAI
ncbi:MAG: thiol peroxidase [Cytophagales bacterium]|jgi:thiol peroxidase|nr:thiol peroxidase [Cytophagales bacterium]MCA6366847.1 thiol peroxidase [Cytophagales bacterium]MCA6370903.1 thiol peroxidase [Cytophagales bacterium]MCA6375320.1 thiol peroxidase [Cytophagales bacterium]MCA6382021.1 thiol peroxidase [Cytophagales bacterium]